VKKNFFETRGAEVQVVWFPILFGRLQEKFNKICFCKNKDYL
jgi:hypothetical protein